MYCKMQQYLIMHIHLKKLSDWQHENIIDEILTRLQRITGHTGGWEIQLSIFYTPN